MATMRHGFHIVAIDRRIECKQIPYEMVGEKVAAELRKRCEARALSQYVRILAGAADISVAMLARTLRTAADLGVEVELLEADVADLPMGDRSVDVVLSLTGLHCFPDPEAAIRELARVSRDRIELSWLRADAGLRYRPILIAGRAGGLVGRSATADDVGLWLAECGFDAEIRIEGAFAYASARRG